MSVASVRLASTESTEESDGRGSHRPYPGREAVVSLVRRYSRHGRVPGSSGGEGKERSRYSHGRHSPGFGALPAQALAALWCCGFYRLLRLAHCPHNYRGLCPEAVQDGIRRKWRLIVMVLSGYR